MINKMYKIVMLWVSLISLSLHGDSNYSFCIEGGGSKTILQVINQNGQILPLIKDGIENDRVETFGSNINSIGPDGVRKVLNSLFERVSLLEDSRELSLNELTSNSYVIAGMAGLSLQQNKQTVSSLLQEKGFSVDHILVMSDADMNLELIHGEGIILISGTGSICLGKKDKTLFRVGGLGKVLGDEGSGYQIGLQALQAVLAEEYGWGDVTTLTPALKDLFQVSELKTLIPEINLGEISSSKIASSASLVFCKAQEKDAIAEKIIDKAADDLSRLLTIMVNKSLLTSCEVNLYGGIFKNKNSEVFIQKIRDKLPKLCQNLNIINRSQDNPAVLLAVRKFVKAL